MSEGKTPPRNLDAVLAGWPMGERTALEWDDSAERVLSLIGSEESTRSGKALGGVSDEDLLRAPLPPAPGEVQSSAPIETRTEGTGMTSQSRERDRAGFRDLAKLANMTPPPSSVSSVRSGERSAPADEKKDWEANSGVIDLAAIAANETGESAEPKAKSGAVSASVAQATMRSAGNEPKPVAAAAVAKREEKPAAEKKGGAPWLTIGGVVAAAAVAAGVFFGMQRSDRAGSPTAVAVAPPPATVAAPATKPVAVAASPTGAPLAADDRGIDPSTLPPASTASAAAPGAVALHGPAPAVAPKPTTTTAAPTTDPALVATIPTATAAPTASASLQTLMQQAAGVTSSPAATAAATATDEGPAPGSVPLKPSQGAIQGALGAALPSARGCLGPDDPISHATITFKSDGSVQSVGVTGGAAGKPAEACIRGALSRARVTPFAQPTFTATATVRPN